MEFLCILWYPIVFMSFHCIVWYCMVLYYILRYCMVLHCWLQRAGCISQDTYLLYIFISNFYIVILLFSRSSTHCSKTKFNPNIPQLTSSLQIIIYYIYTCHFNNKSKYFTESFSRYCPCMLGACVHAHLEKFLDFSFQLA